MSISYQQTIQLTCFQCKQTFLSNVWLILDSIEHRDVINEILGEAVYQVTISCPYCKAISKLDSPLLIYRPNKFPKLIFSPKLNTSDETQYRQQGLFLLNIIKEKLGDKLQEEWVTRMPIVPRPLLSIFLNEGKEAAEKKANELTKFVQGEELGDFQRKSVTVLIGRENNTSEEQQQDPLFQILSLYLHIGVLEESRDIFEKHPEILNDRSEEVLTILMQVAHAKGDDRTEENIKDHLTLLHRCRQVGVRQAFAEWQLVSKGSNLNRIMEEITQLINSSDMPRKVLLCEEALKLVDKEALPALWANLHATLANSLIESPIGEAGEKQEQSISHLNQSLLILNQEQYPEQWALVQSELGRIFTFRIKGNRNDNQEQAIYYFQEALKIYTKTGFKEKWAGLQYHLGKIYSERVNGSRSENLEKSIYYFLQSIEVFNKDTYPVQWASACNLVGLVYHDRVLGERRENLETAINYFKQALEIRSKDIYSFDRAATLNNLGMTYQDRKLGDRAENIEQAIYYYNQALTIFTVDSFPEYYSLAQNGLGNSFIKRIYGEHSQNVEQAISHFNQALTVVSRDNNPSVWAMSHNNLAIAYQRRVLGEKSNNQEEAISHYKQALEVRNKEAYPFDWANTLNNIATIYQKRILGDRGENIDQAISFYEKSLEVRTIDNYPQQFALTQASLAGAYAERIHGNPYENQTKAVFHFQEAAKIFSLEKDPYNYRSLAFQLGWVYISKGNWSLAAETYKTALLADEILFKFAIFKESVEAEILEIKELYPFASYALAKSGRCQEAVEVLEAGRGRQMRDALERKRKDLENLKNAGYGDLYESYYNASNHYQVIYQQFIDATGLDANYSESASDVLASIEFAKQEIDKVINSIRSVAGFEDFLQPLNIKQIQNVSAKNPIIYITTTSVGGLALIVSKNNIEPIWLDKLTSTEVYEQIVKIEEEGIKGYLGAYFNWLQSLERKVSIQEKVQKREDWFITIDRIMHWFWEAGIGILVKMLFEKNITSAFLIPDRLMGLLPLHAAWDYDVVTPTKRIYALDKVNISYTPSAYMLIEAYKKAYRSTDSLLAIDNPDGSLIYSSEEIQIVCNHFEPTKVRILIEEAASVDQVMNDMQVYTVLHFSTHGFGGFIEPLDGFIQLANKESLTLRKILQLHLDNVRLVILSACETSVIGFKLPTEAFTLPSGFMLAGVPGAIGSLWSVDDLGTMLLMGRFYDLWKDEGFEPSKALQLAQIWVRDTTNLEKGKYMEKRWHKVIGNNILHQILLNNPNERDFDHPFYWAGFSYTGI